MFNAVTIEAAFHLAHAIKQQLGSQLEAQNLGIATMHVRVLKVICKLNACTAIDIAGIFKRDKAQITRLVNHLIDQGLVQKEPNPGDKRSQLLTLTSAGRVLQERLRAVSDDMEDQMTRGIEAADLETFMKVAQKITRNLTSQ
ncbi:MarR family transcriptional regulator [Saccharophagus degradans]|uniref:MarR family transcriptional regulator n=1 Tax=Saccharophagus degradans TaxID=86304 RepID=A0AAW7X861_9GAMM|nr:MarR family transcriptional regulator [Saccharophagus degradans]MBU2987066.1 MarR family transcriptional regulator [Saccharophagus degradans]MDO6423764.1 MarR family transcriptional regulator [Saccharophagus degradans]MDO6607844.1 MarR family transcriptional regulator [Saccharophagus degradans]